MKLTGRSGVFLRMGAAGLLACGGGWAFSGLLVAAIEPVAGWLSGWFGPYVHEVQMTLREGMVAVDFRLVLGMTRTDGAPLPAIQCLLHKPFWQMLVYPVVALAVFAAPPVSRRRRLWALPATLAAILLVCGFQQAVELLVQALENLGSDAFQALSPAPTPANYEYYDALRRSYVIWKQVLRFNASGGALFLAVWAGIWGYAFPWPGRRRQAPAPVA